MRGSQAPTPPVNHVRGLQAPNPPVAAAHMSRAACRAGAAMLLPASLLAWASRGPGAAVTALAAVTLVVVWFEASVLSMEWAARRGVAALQAVALGGFAVRLMGMGLAVAALTPLDAIDGQALAMTVGAGVVVLLTCEALMLMRRPDLWWIDPGAATRKEGL